MLTRRISIRMAMSARFQLGRIRHFIDLCPLEFIRRIGQVRLPICLLARKERNHSAEAPGVARFAFPPYSLPAISPFYVPLCTPDIFRRNTPLSRVLLLQHLHLLNDEEEDVKTLSIYSNREAALAAVQRFSVLPGFKISPRWQIPVNPVRPKVFTSTNMKLIRIAGPKTASLYETLLRHHTFPQIQFC